MIYKIVKFLSFFFHIHPSCIIYMLCIFFQQNVCRINFQPSLQKRKRKNKQRPLKKIVGNKKGYACSGVVIVIIKVPNGTFGAETYFFFTPTGIHFKPQILQKLQHDCPIYINNLDNKRDENGINFIRLLLNGRSLVGFKTTMK